jgi:CHAD domain-containing protein
MEVEAKFVLPDQDTVSRLIGIVRLGPFVPAGGTSRQVRDRYLDTSTFALYRSGYACRLRDQGGRRIATLKGLGAAESAIHRRVEKESALPDDAGLDPGTWPEGEVRELALSLSSGLPLVELFVIEQTRYVRELVRDERTVAEMSIDQGEIHAGGQQRPFWTLEIELLASGTLDDLEFLVQHLTQTWGLVPEPYTKFDWGLAFLDQVAAGGGEGTARLSMEERVHLQEIAGRAEDRRAQEWAQLILGWDRGVPVRELAKQAGLSRSWSYELLQRFRAERLSIFPAGLVAPEELESARFQGEEPPEPEVQVPGVDLSDPDVVAALPAAHGTVTIDELCERFQVDMAHAYGVVRHAVVLFDATASFHKLGPEHRHLLEVMGLLHNVGLETDPDRHHVAGRDIVLDNPIDGLTEIEQRMVAAAIYLHRKKINRKRLQTEVVTSLPPGIRNDVLVLAALLRAADGLDFSQGQTSVLGPVQVTSAAILACVSGPSAQVDAARAQAKADLWERLFDVPFLFSTQDLPAGEPGAPSQESHDEHRVAMPAASEPKPARVQVDAPGVLPADPMSEAGRKVLYFHFLRMLKHEQGTRAGEDIEELHDMRVATRRMRAALRVFGPYFKSRAIRPYVVGLRRTARALGAVRDLDVFMEEARTYLATLPAEQAHDLDPLLEAWQAQRKQARAEMIAYLDGAKYRDFVQAFQLFLETAGAGERKFRGIPPEPTHVAHVGPQLIYTCWAGVQAFGPLLHGAPVAVLHALRIECKKLRYVLEFFREVLGPEVGEVIAEVTALQDHLGHLNDANVANALLSDFLFGSGRDDSSPSLIAPGVVAYLAVKQRELQRLMGTFPQAWEQFNRPEVRRWLAGAVAVL